MRWLWPSVALLGAWTTVGEERAVGACLDVAANCSEWANASAGLTGCAKLPGVLLRCASTCEACSMRNTVELATRCEHERQPPDCYNWANAGQCEVNTGYMIRHCRAACGDYGSRMAWMASRLATIHGCERGEELPEDCEDRLDDCAERAKKTLTGCAEESGLLLKCPRTCGACPHLRAFEMASTCEDKNELCATWASEGECGNNTNYMLRNCRYSCGDLGSRVAWMALRVTMQSECTRPKEESILIDANSDEPTISDLVSNASSVVKDEL